MTINELVIYLKSPYYKEVDVFNKDKKMCNCGMVQTHRLLYCNDCGGKFEYDLHKVSLLTVIYNQCNYNIYRKRDFGEKGLGWWYAILKREINVTYEEFKEAYFKAIN